MTQATFDRFFSGCLMRWTVDHDKQGIAVAFENTFNGVYLVLDSCDGSNLISFPLDQLEFL